MQSGKHQLSISGHKHAITSLLIEFSNSYLISSDASGLMLKHDFYLGTFLKSEVIFIWKQLKPISFLRNSNISSLFMIAYNDNTIEIWEADKFKRAR